VASDVGATDDPENRREMRRSGAYSEIASTCPVCGHSQLFTPDQVEQMCRLVVHHRCPLCKKLSTVDDWLFPVANPPGAVTNIVDELPADGVR
jgi:hypothetical protein